MFSKKAPAKNALIFLFNLHKRILTLISDRASDYEGGTHPKHRLMQYHKFFSKRITSGQSILDIGSGKGPLAYDLARAGANVTGIEISRKNFDIANGLYKLPNLHFIYGDAWKDVPNKHFDTIVMSNVLEHIDDRVGFIKKIQKDTFAKKWLIRVPCFDRDWIVPLAKELGLDSRLDETHFTEFTDETFRKEMSDAGLEIIHFEKQWGEIWAELIPKK